MKSKYVLSIVVLLVTHFARADYVSKTCDVNELGQPKTSKPGCQTLFDQFCKDLFSSKNKGDMDVISGQQHLPILRGTQNGFDHSLIAYDRAKLEAIRTKTLPEDFLKNLSPEYPVLMEKYLATPDLKKMSYTDFRDFKKMGTDLSHYMGEAWDKTVQDRVEAKIPGYYTTKASSRTLEEEKLAAKIEDEFSSSFYGSLWKNNENYKKSKEQFYEVKKAMLEYVKTDPNISEVDRKEITERVTSVDFNGPSSAPLQDHPTCFGTEENAFYTPSTNNISMCAGFFNTIPSLYSTYAHELSHSLSVTRSKIVEEDKSVAGKKMKALIESVCKSNKSETCPKEWKEFTQAFESSPNVANNHAVLKELRVCLQRTEPENKIFDKNGKETEEYTKTVVDAADERATDVIDDSAQNNEFLELTLPKVYASSTDETLINNPLYLNPCAREMNLTDADYRMGSDLAFETVAVAAYKCSEKKEGDAKLKEAILKTEDFFKKRVEQSYRNGAELNPTGKMANKDYADNSEERVADILGNRVFTRILESKFTVLDPNWAEKRRHLFFSNTAFLCDPISIDTVDPKKAEVEASFSSEVHSTNSNRRMDLLLPPMSEALGCEVDFEDKVCK